ncbi:MAG: hypothetical protein EB039_15360, partial [Proteobacteria bacterium]|nr:hypothetical protein [Pseudomonadota bacterium]
MLDQRPSGVREAAAVYANKRAELHFTVGKHNSLDAGQQVTTFITVADLGVCHAELFGVRVPGHREFVPAALIDSRVAASASFQCVVAHATQQSVIASARAQVVGHVIAQQIVIAAAADKVL